MSALSSEPAGYATAATELLQKVNSCNRAVAAALCRQAHTCRRCPASLLSPLDIYYSYTVPNFTTDTALCRQAHTCRRCLLSLLDIYYSCTVPNFTTDTAPALMATMECMPGGMSTGTNISALSTEPMPSCVSICTFAPVKRAIVCPPRTFFVFFFFLLSGYLASRCPAARFC
jgi:hypothetical protein